MFFNFVTGLFDNIVFCLILFYVPTDDLDWRIKLLYFAAIYFLYSSVFLFIGSSSLFLVPNVFEALAPIVLLPNFGWKVEIVEDLFIFLAKLF